MKTKLARLLLVLLFATVIPACTAEKPVEWTLVRGAAQTEAAPQSFAQSTAPTVQQEIPTQTEETEAVTNPVEESGEYISASSEISQEPTASDQIEMNPTEEVQKRSLPEQTDAPVPDTATGDPQVAYIANTNTKKFHYPDCSSVRDMKESNKLYFTGTRDELIEQGYQPCKRCSP